MPVPEGAQESLKHQAAPAPVKGSRTTITPLSEALNLMASNPSQPSHQTIITAPAVAPRSLSRTTISRKHHGTASHSRPSCHRASSSFHLFLATTKHLSMVIIIIINTSITLSTSKPWAAWPYQRQVLSCQTP